MTNDNIPPTVNLRFTSRGGPTRDQDWTRSIPTTPGHSASFDFIRHSDLGLPVGAKLTLEMPGDYVRTWEIVP